MVTIQKIHLDYTTGKNNIWTWLNREREIARRRKYPPQHILDDAKVVAKMTLKHTWLGTLESSILRTLKNT